MAKVRRGTSGSGIAIVTGAAGGIGLELMPLLQQAGYQVVGVDLTENMVAEASANRGIEGVTAVGCDLTDDASLQNLIERIRGEFAADLDIFVANAGIIIPGDVGDISDDQAVKHLRIMLEANVRILNAITPIFREKNSGHIMGTISMGGIIAMPSSAVYSAAKAGMRAYFQALNAELAHTGVAVSGIFPSAVDTPMLYFEATHGGSVLNFIGKVFHPKDIAEKYMKAIRKPKLENYVPFSDSITTRLVNFWPWSIPKLLPLFVKGGEKGRTKYIATSANRPKD